MALQKSDEDSVLVRSMKSQLERLPDLEKENRQLKDENQFIKYKDLRQINMYIEQLYHILLYTNLYSYQLLY